MKLLMITRKIDRKDASPAGFTYTWVRKLGEKLEKLYVITWQESERGNLPENIEVISLPNSKLLKIFILPFRLFRVLPKIDGVFCHQNPEYTILTAPWTKLFGKKLIAWYAHGYVGWKLHLINWLADKILTSSDKGCRLKNRKKIEVIGQGIDIDYFKPSKNYLAGKKFKIISVGRISPVKNYETLIRVIKTFKLIRNFELKIIGQSSLKSDQEYFEKLKNLAQGSDIEFVGGVSHNQILPYYQDCDLFINLSQTGSLDKAVLEAMACEKLVLTSNEAFKNLLKDDRLIFELNSFQDLGSKIYRIIELPEQEKNIITKKLRNIVVKNHNLDNLVSRIINQYEKS